MKRFFAFIWILAALLFYDEPAHAQQGLKYSQYPRVTTANPRYLILWADPGITNYAQLWSDLQAQIIAIATNGQAVVSTNIITTNFFATYITNFLEFTTNLFATYETVTNLTAITETNNTFITTNVTINFPGGVTNLNLTANSVMYSDNNDAEASIPNAVGVLTNNGIGGIGFSSSMVLTELDALNAYLTNLFTFLTNAQYLMTDANGKVIAGTGLPATNVLLSAGANITFTTNGDGSITVAASGNVSITTITNTTLYSTNAYITTVYAQTNYSTNLFFVSGKGNTLVVTNVTIEVGGALTNKNIAASSAVITDSNQVETNAVNAHGVFTNSATGPPSFGLLQNTELKNSSITIAGTANQVSVSGGGPVALGGTATLSLPSPVITPGNLSAPQITNTSFAASGVVTNDANGKTYTTPTLQNALLANSSITIQGSAVALGGSTLAAGSAPSFDLSSSTNLIYRYTTNALTAITMTFGKAYTTNVSANIVFTAVNAQDLAALETVCLFATNSGGTDRTITLPNGIGSPGLGLPPVITVTNKQSCWIYVQHYGNQATNCWFIPSY